MESELAFYQISRIWRAMPKYYDVKKRHKFLNIFRSGNYALPFLTYEGNSISKLQIQVATYVFELSAGNCHR